MIRKTLTAAPSSYELKHVAERSRAGYFTNGQFIVAALLAGFPVDMASGDYNPGYRSNEAVGARRLAGGAYPRPDLDRPPPSFCACTSSHPPFASRPVPRGV